MIGIIRENIRALALAMQSPAMRNMRIKANLYRGSSESIKKNGAITLPIWPRMLLTAIEVAFFSGERESVLLIHVLIRGFAPKRPPIKKYEDA